MEDCTIMDSELDNVIMLPGSSAKSCKLKDKIIMIVYIKNNLIFEKYNTKYSYFFVSDLLNTLCIVD